MQRKFNWLSIISICLVVLTMGMVLNVNSNIKDIDVNPEVTVNPQVVDYPTAAEVVAELNLSNDNTEVLEILNEDNNWEIEAEEIATAEWEENDYKDIYKFIDGESSFYDIRDRDDIDYVKEDADTRFRRMDADDEDARVTQYVKVRYEDEEGDNKKVYLKITSEIKDGELEDQEIEVN